VSKIQGQPVSVTLDGETALRIFVDLEEFVVSLDRILSRIGRGADPEILVDFFVERRVFQRLALARRDVTEAVEQYVDSAVLDELAESGYKYTDPT
jgi:hypothetical protein